MEVSQTNIAEPRKYPQRKRTKVAYSEFEMSMDQTPKKTKNSKTNTEIAEDEENEKENNMGSEIEEEEISEYEKIRLKNLEENRKMMLELGLIDPEKEKRLNDAAKKPKLKPKTVKPKKAVVPKTPTKRSLRLLKKTPDGKDIPLDLFQDSPLNTPTLVEEVKARIEEEELPMNEDGESTDFLDRLKLAISEDSPSSSGQSVDSLVDNLRSLKFAAIKKVNFSRVQSLCIHPMETKLLVISGSRDGELALWNVNEDEVVQYKPHVRALNCISTSSYDQSIIYTTSHDGTIRMADLNKGVFDLIYQTDEKRNKCHLTWHSEIDANRLLIAHGTGEVGVLDIRTTRVEQWFHCHPRSTRTLQFHPTQTQYFLSSSGTGESKIWDLRVSKKHNDVFVGELSTPKNGKGLTSAFFSPDGTKIATTCNDDYIRIYDSSDLANPTELQKMMHDNHTGRWLSVFKTIWHPLSSDLLFVGSMLHPRRIQLYNSSGRLMRELKDEMLTTVVPVISLHPTQPIVVGGNSTGKAHVFATPDIIYTHVNSQDDSQ